MVAVAAFSVLVIKVVSVTSDVIPDLDVRAVDRTSSELDSLEGVAGGGVDEGELMMLLVVDSSQLVDSEDVPDEALYRPGGRDADHPGRIW
jgi:hypothetical protein